MTVKEIAKQNPQGLIGRAFIFTEEVHRGQRRKTGEPYFNHALGTAEILNGWRLDEATIAAGLLHDTAEDTSVPLDAIRSQFGDEVAFIVDGVTKLGRVKYRGEETKVDNLRKLILALSQDLRVIFVKLADRLNNMRTLQALPPQKQKRVALETDEIYAPLAYRLGMQNLSGELRDLAFPYLHPKEYEWLKKTVGEKYEERTKYLEKIKSTVEKIIKSAGTNPISIDFRAKRWSSLYQKLLRHDMDIEKIHDLVAMRIIVETVGECYAILGALHSHWPPLPGRIKDYVAMPKPNGYRSLHTTIIGPDKKILEFQIRTREMHEEDENGVAAHWIYEQIHTSREKPATQKLTEEISWIQQLRHWQEKIFGSGGQSEEFINAMKIDFFKDRIFAITPKGEVVDLPVGATPVDFAYQIHSEIGNSCVGAKINNKITPLNAELRSGDLVEIIIQKNKKPSEDWLKFVKTASAREHIKAALRHKGGLINPVKSPRLSEIKITAIHRLGLLKDITAVIARSHIHIKSADMPSQAGSRFTIMKFQCDTTDKIKIEKLILKLKNFKEVKEVSWKLV